MPFDLPAGSVAGYFPECNPLVPLGHHADKSHVPASKCIPVRVERATASVPVPPAQPAQH